MTVTTCWFVRGGDAGVGVRGPGEDGGCECVEGGEEGQLQLEEGDDGGEAHERKEDKDKEREI